MSQPIGVQRDADHWPAYLAKRLMQHQRRSLASQRARERLKTRSQDIIMGDDKNPIILDQQNCPMEAHSSTPRRASEQVRWKRDCEENTNRDELTAACPLRQGKGDENLVNESHICTKSNQTNAPTKILLSLEQNYQTTTRPNYQVAKQQRRHSITYNNDQSNISSRNLDNNIRRQPSRICSKYDKKLENNCKNNYPSHAAIGRSKEYRKCESNSIPFSQLVILTLIITFLAMSLSSSMFAIAYQLTNNLIANNSPPKFIATSSTEQGTSNSEIVVRVKEGPGSIGKLIYTLRGEDRDDDPLTFGVLGSMASDLLRIDNVPGNQANVYLRKELDRETTDSYQVVITLTDGKLGRGNWITKSMLIIVEDVNDNFPVFGPHRTAISIREDTKVPLVIETIEASDQDEGRFGQVIYKLDELDDSSSSQASGATSRQAAATSSSGGLSSMFSIETVDGKGIISLISPLDYEQRPLYQLRVLAVDRAHEHERLTASTSILISVEDCDDRPPMFTFVPSITRIPESLPVGSPIVRVAAMDGDRGINNPIEYKLISVNGQENGFERSLFSMEPESGQISVAHELDRESDSDWSSVTSASGTHLASRPGNEQSASTQPGSYVLQIRASELGSSASEHSVGTELTIILTDINDETPTFNQATYYGEILENSAPESLVTFVLGPSMLAAGSAWASPEQPPVASTQQQAAQSQAQPPSAKVVDRDQGTNGTFTLHLEGEHSHLFDIWPREATNEANFMIKVAAPIDSKLQPGTLDYERTKMFTFMVVAREKFTTSSNHMLRSNSAQMSVYVKDTNDNYPQFESELYRVEIPENAIRGMHICAVKATDADSGAYGSQGIRYTEIRGEKANKLKLDPVTGVITLKTNEHGFDRETIGQHHLIVEARDSNGLGNRNTTQLLIILTDVNDQRPKFLLDQYEAFIYENEPDFQSPLQVQAVDNDAPNTVNSRILYSIAGGDPQGNFTIDPQTGRIRVRNSLVLPPKGGVATLNPLNSGDSSIVLDDTSSFQTPTTNGQPAGGGLDFERIAQKRDDTRQFNLTIKATDMGSPEPLSSLAQVLVLVYDRNDHAPVFTKSIYSKSIREDAKEGSRVLQVLAQDGDHSPTNSKITYRISSGASDKFVIDSDSGLISVANGANLDIDRVVGGQKRTSYLLSVLAFDGSFGPNQKSSSALVNITIVDVNNKPPEFLALGTSNGQARTNNGSNIGLAAAAANQQQMVVHVNEDAPYGLIVTRVLAVDLDSSAELRYSINYGRSEARNEDMVLVEPSLIKDLFTIEPTDGTIKVAKQLDRELFDQVKLRLQVEDIAAQTSDQVAYAYLLVKITDVNDNRPVFKKPVYKAVVNENSISGTSVITLTADDRDLNKTLRYSLDGPAPEIVRLVRINPRSGEVTVNDKIDRELYPFINVTVRAEDSGYPQPLTGTAQLLITVRDENDNNPMFLNSTNLQAMHTYHHQPGDPSALYPPHSELAGGPKNHNMLNGTTISSATIGYRPRSLGASTATDSWPTEAPEGANGGPALSMLAPGATARIREDAPIGHQVAYVRAEDADVGNNGRVTYLLDSASSGGKFRIDRDTGIISVSGNLDRESSKNYPLIIEACDNYDLGYSTGESRRAFTQVNIQVTDVNDNAPVIVTNLQTTSALTSQGHSSGASESGASSMSSHHSMPHPSYDELMSSPGPYQQPLANCLFISEFQPLNEPILTITATDADDPSTANGQIDLAIVNNLPQNELFGLANIPGPAGGQTADEPNVLLDMGGSSSQASSPASPASTTDRSTTDPAANDLAGFGEAQNGPSSAILQPELELLVHEASAPQVSRSGRRPDGPSNGSPVARTRRHLAAGSTLLDPGAPGNYYAPQALRLHHQPRGLVNSANLRQQPQPTTTRSSPLPPSAHRQPVGVTEAPPLVVSATMSSVRHHSSGLANPVEGGEQQVHVVVVQSLKERVGNYSILVRATDRGRPALSSVRAINICVQDVNNHSPVFVRPPLNHTIRVLENATIGTYVSQVEATDADFGLNGELHYSLKPTNIQNNNNDWQAFKIDRSSGVITTAKLFNRQLKKYYTLRVQAQDFGRPTSLSSDIDINIMIINSGQYQPEFDLQTQTFQFTENIAPGAEWFTLVATTNLDDDPALINGMAPSGSNWLTTPCYFIVDSDDQEQLFHLDRYTHRLSNKRALDREKKANYTLLVQATNNCNKPPAAPIYVRPLGSSSSESATSAAASSEPLRGGGGGGGDGSGASVEPQASAKSGRSARSLNEDGDLPLQALVRDKKSINQTLTNAGGERHSADLINGQSDNSEQAATAANGFNQAAIDSLLAADKSLLKVFIKVKDINDNAPRFTQHVYTGGITTEADFGTIFMIVQAVDADADSNSQVTYSIVKPIKRNLATGSIGGSTGASNSKTNNLTSSPVSSASKARPRRAATQAAQFVSPIVTNTQTNSLVTTIRPQMNLYDDGYVGNQNYYNDILMSEGDDLFVINAQTGEISLNFDPQKHMKGYFEFEVLANDTDGLGDSAKVFIYLLRQDQRVKFVLRLTPQELRQRLNKFRSVFGNITGAIVNIDSYKYYENHDGTVDKKKTSLYLHFVNPDDNTIIDVDKVLTLIDNNIEYLDELYKEFHVLSSEAAHLPLSSSALIDPIDQIRTGLMGVASFLALILILVIALCLNQRTRYERQLKAATVSAFGSSPLHMNPDFHSQTNLPNTNLHSQDPNPIWMNGYSDHEWLSAAAAASKPGHGLSSNPGTGGGAGNEHGAPSSGHAEPGHAGAATNGDDSGDYLSSENSDLNSLSGVNSVNHLRYNATATATPRDSLNSSHGRVSGSGSGSTSTTNDRQALCRAGGRQTPQQAQHRAEVHQTNHQVQVGTGGARGAREPEMVGVLKGAIGVKKEMAPGVGTKKRSHHQLNSELAGTGNTGTHSTFGAFKEVTIYTDHSQQGQYVAAQQSHHQQQGGTANNLVRTVNLSVNGVHDGGQQQHTTTQVNKIASQFNAKHSQAPQPPRPGNQSNQIYISQSQSKQVAGGSARPVNEQQRILVHANGADVNQGIIKSAMNGTANSSQQQQLGKTRKVVSVGKFAANSSGQQPQQARGQAGGLGGDLQQQLDGSHVTADNFETNLSKLSILNLETTEL